MFTLRPYQDTAVNALRAAFADCARAPLFVLSTGGGKTVIFCYIAHNAAAFGTRVTICVHRRELLRQTSAALKGMEVPHGLIAPGERATADLIQVASVQTLVRRKSLQAPDLIIYDEGHHATAGTWEKITARYPGARILGVTATPCRMDGRGLGHVYDRLIEGPSMQELIDGGYLVEPEVWAPGTVDLSGVRTRMGDFKRDELNAAMDKRQITGDVVKHYGRHCDRKPTIAFCVSVAHAEHVAEEFRQAGYCAASVDGTMDRATRDDRISSLGDGRLDVLTSCDLISEGLDIPVVEAAILLRPTKSLGLYMQQVGRCLRPAPGKTKAVILDHVGNVVRHKGFPQTPRQWSLDRGVVKDEKDGQELRVCHECHLIHPWAEACPNCGFVYPTPEPVDATPEQVAGELRKLDPEEFERLNYEANSLKDMHKLCKEKGYKPGWAWGEHHRRRKGVYPERPARQQEEFAV